MQEADYLVLGSGLAGLLISLELAEAGQEVVILTGAKDETESNSWLAQGGIIYNLGDKELLYNDIMRASQKTSLDSAVRQLVNLGSSYVEEVLLKKLNVPFAKDDNGNLKFTKEAAHSSDRIIYSADRTGKAIINKLFERVQSFSNIKINFLQDAVDLIKDGDRCIGAYAFTGEPFLARETILATGGLCKLFSRSTNAKGIVGSGIAMAHRAGAKVADLDRIQFHPTAFYKEGMDSFLLTEALRGEGGVLINDKGEAFMHHYHELLDLAPRNIVSKAMHKEKNVWLDISFKGRDFLINRFPNIYRQLLDEGIDFTKEPMPVSPAAHYLCGGVVVDRFSKTNIDGLRAVGEASCTGLHGINRLASTSLLEAVVWAKECVKDMLANKKELIKANLSRLSFNLLKTSPDIPQIMWDYVGIDKTKESLLLALEKISGYVDSNSYIAKLIIQSSLANL